MPELEDTISETFVSQRQTEDACLALLNSKRDSSLAKELHCEYLAKLIDKPLPAGFKSLDASKPWLVYWSVNGCALLGRDISLWSDAISKTIMSFQSATGGIGGGFYQLGHIAASYAAINSLALSGNESAWKQLNRAHWYDWLMSLKRPDGSFSMCQGGETDPRSTYCAFSIASLLGILTPELVENTAEYIKSCQTYEGGFANIPGGEAHGGYTFTAIATLCFLGDPADVIPRYVNIDNLIRWLSLRQMEVEGGFSGRTNKLVDACYSQWVGGVWDLLLAACVNNPRYSGLWDEPQRIRLETYLLACCQNTSAGGGLRDKPGARPDGYHTNYSLCGLSYAAYKYSFKCTNPDAGLGEWTLYWNSRQIRQNGVEPINPVHVLPHGVAEKMMNFFLTL